MKKIITLLVAAALLFTLSADIFAVAPEIPAPAATTPLTVLNFTGSFSCYNYELPDRIAQMLTNAGYDYKLEEPEVDPKDDLPVPLGGADFASVAVIKDKVLSARLYYYQWSINYQTGATEYEFFTAAVYHSENFGTGYKLGTGMTDEELAAAALDDGFSVNPANPKLYSNGKYNLEYKIADSGNEFILMTEHTHDEGATLSDYSYDEAHHWRTVIGCWCNGKEIQRHHFNTAGSEPGSFILEDKCFYCDHTPTFSIASFVGMERSEAIKTLKEKFGSQFVTDEDHNTRVYDDGMGLVIDFWYRYRYTSMDPVEYVESVDCSSSGIVVTGKLRRETTYGMIKDYISANDLPYKEYDLPVNDGLDHPGLTQREIVMKLPNAYVPYFQADRDEPLTDDSRFILGLEIRQGLEVWYQMDFFNAPFSDLIGKTKADLDKKMQEYEFFIEDSYTSYDTEYTTEYAYQFWCCRVCVLIDKQTGEIEEIRVDSIPETINDDGTYTHDDFSAEMAPGLDIYKTVAEIKEMEASGKYTVKYSERESYLDFEGAKILCYDVISDGFKVRYELENWDSKFDMDLGSPVYWLLTDDEILAAEVQAEYVTKAPLPEFQRGDLDGSGKEPNVTDGVIMQRILAGIEEKISAADLNNDGIINVADGVTMQRILAGLE